MATRGNNANSANSASAATAAAARIIKKYPNRRLYDTQTSTYITVTDVKQLVLDGEIFRVVDAKSGDDLTRAVLLQIILDEESAGKPIFSEVTLANLIRFYGHAMQGMMGSYLEKNMQAFLEIQERLAEQQKAILGDKKAAANGAAGAEMWSQFMNYQTPVIQNMMSNYLEQSKNMFVQMQDQFQSQTANMFGGFPFPMPGVPGAPGTPDNKK